jgi:hypothetical protein
MDEGLCLFLKLIHLNSISNPSKRGETHGFGFSFRPELTFLSHEQHAHTTKTIGEKTFLASSTPFPVNVLVPFPKTKAKQTTNGLRKKKDHQQ